MNKLRKIQENQKQFERRVEKRDGWTDRWRRTQMGGRTGGERDRWVDGQGEKDTDGWTDRGRKRQMAGRQG